MNIELHIEEIVLHGFAQGVRYRIVEAIQNELARLLTEKGLPGLFEQNIEFSSIDGGSIMIGSGESTRSLGVRIGQSVYRGMESPARRER